MVKPSIPTVFKFDEFSLNTIERTLNENGKEVEIPSKTFDVLQLLIKKYGETVTKMICLKRFGRVDL